MSEPNPLAPEDSVPRSEAEDLIYVLKTRGHRQAYLDLLGPMFHLTPVTGRMTPRLFRRLVSARRLLFATLDDDVAGFTAVTAARGALGRPTAALFLRPHSCFSTAKRIYRVKHYLFRTLRHLPGLTIATILPFSLEPHYRLIAHMGLHDPQFWDMHDGSTVRRPRTSALAEQIVAEAAGRQIVCIVGALSGDKGFRFATEALVRNPELTKTVHFVAAGTVTDDCRDVAETFSDLGGRLVQGRLSDEELESLYAIAHKIWACYAPDYDQASGIFGRAIQWGVPVIIRAGSRIHRLTAPFALCALPVEFGNHDDLYTVLADRAPSQLEGEAYHRHVARVGAWRHHFKHVLGAVL